MSRPATVLLCPYADADGVRKLALRGMTVDRVGGVVHGVDTRSGEPRSMQLADIAHMHLTGDDATGRRRSFDCRRPRTRDAKRRDKLPGA